MRFYLINRMTCTRVKLFGEDLKKLFISNGWKESSFSDADYLLINSCSFLKSREDYFIREIEKMVKDRKSNQKIVVFGCLPSTNPKRILALNNNIVLFSRNLEGLISYFGFKNKNFSLSTITNADLTFTQKIISWLNNIFLNDPNITLRLMKKNVFHVRISSGCMGNCSYCSERFTTVFKSRKIIEVVDSFAEGLHKGFKVFAINSDDSSCFGLDNRENIVQLLSKLVSFEGDYKIAVTEFNPQGLFIKNILNHLSSKKICYITIPVQSGSQKILNKMRRPYKINSVIEKVLEIKKINPILKINTHLIVGFPGESETDFMKTLFIVKSGLFDRIKVFKYSDRPNTDASKFHNKVSEGVKRRRAKILQRAIILDAIKKRDFVNFLLNLKQI